MGVAIDYQKLMTEVVYINLPGPPEPMPTMSGGELLHGFLAELGQSDIPEVIQFVEQSLANSSNKYGYGESKPYLSTSSNFVVKRLH